MRVLGIDVGKRRDPSALVACDGQLDRRHRSIVNAARLPLGMTYPDQVEAIVMASVGSDVLVVDATGVGGAVVDMIRARGLKLWAVTLTAGKNITINRESMGASIPKRSLVELISATADHGHLIMTKGDAMAVQGELRSFQRQQRPNGSLRFEASGTDHDDLVVALGLSLAGFKITEAMNRRGARAA